MGGRSVRELVLIVAVLAGIGAAVWGVGHLPHERRSYVNR